MEIVFNHLRLPRNISKIHFVTIPVTCYKFLIIANCDSRDFDDSIDLEPEEFIIKSKVVIFQE